MSPWFAKAVIVFASIAWVAIRAPHRRRSLKVAVSKSRKGILEIVVLTSAWLAFFLPLIWVVTPAFASMDYALRPVPLVAGTLCFALGLWLIHRSHADLGTNWSVTLELREEHRLVTKGVYRRVRHPMYSALFIYSAGQALVLPNYLAGPSSVVAMGLLFALRVGAEERMMLEAFGSEYEAYRERTKRLVPGIW